MHKHAGQFAMSNYNVVEYHSCITMSAKLTYIDDPREFISYDEPYILLIAAESEIIKELCAA